MKPNAIVIHLRDNVAIALEDIPKEAFVCIDVRDPFPAKNDVAYSHKVLLSDICLGEDIVKYGEVIGQANGNFKQGEWIHTHNLQTGEE